MTPELHRLVSRLPQAPVDGALFDHAGRTLGIVWPQDYAAVVAQHNGVEGEIGQWSLVLTPAEELVEANTHAVMRSFPGLVIVGGDGGGEALAIHRGTGQVLLVPWIGSRDDWLVLGQNFTEALQRMERGKVFDAPKWSGADEPPDIPRR